MANSPKYTASENNVQILIDQLEEALCDLDSLGAQIAAIHVDTAIIELCAQNNIKRSHHGRREI